MVGFEPLIHMEGPWLSIFFVTRDLKCLMPFCGTWNPVHMEGPWLSVFFLRRFLNYLMKLYGSDPLFLVVGLGTLIHMEGVLVNFFLTMGLNCLMLFCGTWTPDPYGGGHG